MTPPEQYDAIVIGSGQAGGPLATALAQAGRRTALIEREHVGGTCINEGCTPTKTMVASGRVAYLARRAAEYGVETGPVRVDLARCASANGPSSRRSAREASVGSRRQPDSISCCGEGRFVGPRTIAVGDRSLLADQVFINVGCRSGRARHHWNRAGASPSTRPRSWSWMPVPSTCWWSAAATSGSSSPRCSGDSAAGSPSCSAAEQLLPLEDDDIAEAVTTILREDGIEVLLDAGPRCAEPLRRWRGSADRRHPLRRASHSRGRGPAGRGGAQFPTPTSWVPLPEESTPTQGGSSSSTSGWRPPRPGSGRWVT